MMKRLLMCLVIAACVLPCGNGLCSDDFMIGGYWENWKSPLYPAPGTDDASPKHYEKDFSNFDLIYYSFLTLAKTPDPADPKNEQWDGKHLYESMTRENVIDVMVPAGWENPNNWQRKKIQAMLDECDAKGKKFIWAVGGWSDLTRTISDEQIPVFVDKCVELLKIAGHGIDFDWEHLSNDPSIRDQQRRVLGKIIPALRTALDENRLSDKLIGYTTRFNAFWDDSTRPSGVEAFDSDGEGIDVGEALAQGGGSFEKSVDWVNIMLYDIPPASIGAPDGLTLETYKMVLGFFEKFVPKEKIVMGFEPGDQAAGGVWEGMDVDRQAIDHIRENGYGGVMFWAANHPGGTGENSQDLAGYARSGASIILGKLK